MVDALPLRIFLACPGWPAPPGEPGPDTGSLLAVVPNHVCPVVNLARELIVVDGDGVVDAWRVPAQSAV